MTQQKPINLGLYYQYFYPYQAIVNWLTYKGKKPLNHRELSFEYEGGSVQRYVVFNNADDFRKKMTQKQQNLPRKVDAGAIWSQIPKKDQPGRTEQRQLIFDFDMNDYDDVRNCCQGKKVCVLCWKLLIVAIDILKVTLQEDFDLHKFMYVFSGGRGVHIWVCDERARKMKDQVRRSLVDYLQLVTGNDKAESMLGQNVLKPVQKIQKLFLSKQRPDLDFTNKQSLKKYYIRHNFPYQVQRSLQIIKSKKFLQIFKQQQALQFPKGRAIIQKILRSRSKQLMQRVFERWQKCANQTIKLYQILLEQVDLYQKGSIVDRQNPQYSKRQMSKNGQYKNITFIEQEIMLTFLYPRMDYNVSTAQNHLLKLPFSVHPTSHKISVPIFAHQVKDFDPKGKSIEFDTLMQDLKDLEKKYGGPQYLKRQNVMEECSLKTYIDQLKRFTEENC